MNKTPVSKITIIRTEGPAGSDFEGHEFTSFADAQHHLVSISQGAPEPDEGGYDKVEFLVEWEDGETYAGRYDLVRGAGDQLCDQVINTCTFYLGLRKPAHMSAKDYIRFLGRELAQRAAVLTGLKA